MGKRDRKSEGKSKNKKGRRGGGGAYRSQRREEIVFDPEARKEYLKGFSERKRNRRAYGLAMQKVKDRKTKLEQRADQKQAVKEQIEQAEKQKESILDGIIEEREFPKGPLVAAPTKKLETDNVDNVQTYEDNETKSHWGGAVTVTTSTHIPGDSSSDEEEEQKKSPNKKNRNADEAQEYAGNVERFIDQLKGNMPSKRKNKDRRLQHKGKHGASTMKGMAGSGDLKIVQKALQRTEAKQKGKGKGRGGKRKNR